MRAAVITEPGGPEVLELQEMPDPTFGPDEVLVAVHASALNRLDLIQRRGRYPIPHGVRADIPGVEIAGVVQQVGARVQAWKPGDRVMALVNGEGQATRLAVHERMLMPIPANLNFTEAASIPEVFLTAYDALMLQCELGLGESVLIHAIGSGVGTAAVQLARAQSCRTFGTAGSAEKLDKARALGLDVGINYHEQDFAEVVERETGGKGVNVILDVIGAPYWEQNSRSIAMKGRMVTVGSMGGSVLEKMNIGFGPGRRASVRGTSLRNRPFEEKAILTQLFIERIVPLFERGIVKAVIDRVFPFAEIGAAHELMESNANFGKIVLDIGG
ncbi:MAG: NAD(P)H-quinone oxidoreductase [Dehalococcoidia bacterium]|nr:NAD(P)H-quinone oxidoreductase [Dehalococcoidia bacterium]